LLEDNLDHPVYIHRRSLCITGCTSFTYNTNLGKNALFDISNPTRGTYTVTGATTNDLEIYDYGIIEVNTTYSGTFAINGFTGGLDGRRLTLISHEGTWDMGFNDETGSAAANQIVTMTGGGMTCTNQCSATFVYSGPTSRWVMTEWSP